MSSEGLYITLPSNVVDPANPRNTNTAYGTTLQTPLVLRADTHEVGLVEMQYSTTWDTLPESTLEYKTGPEGSEETGIVRLPGGIYDTHQALLTEISRAIESAEVELTSGGSARLVDTVTISYNTVTRLCCVATVEPTLSVRFSYELAAALGFKPNTWYNPSSGPGGQLTSPTDCDLRGGMTALFVYSNIVQTRVVGGSMVRLLRTITTDNDRGRANVSREFRRVHYLPAESGTFRQLDIDIRRDDGTPVPFKGGKVLATLHVREKKKLQL